jgi:hypothetical protein
MIFKLNLLLLLVCILNSCYVGTERDACRYNLKKSKPVTCEGDGSLILLIPPKDGDYQGYTERASLFLIECLQYYERLKDCDKDNKRFKPGLYGNNQLYPSSEFYLGNNLLSIYRRYSKYNIIKQS